MPTLKQIKESKIKTTSKLLKKDKDFLHISPEFIKDLRDKILLENSALKLSINDYKLMCKNIKVLNMMSIALNKPKAKLKKFCKYLSVFEENISKSSKSIANKINGPITNLPKEIRSTILERFAEILPTKYVLLDWIDKDKLDWDCLSENSNAIDLLKENPNKINWKLLSNNPNAIDLLDERIKYEKTLTKEQYNNLELYEKIHWSNLSANPNAIDLLKKNYDKINWINLSKNPNAIKLLLANKDEINWRYLSGNKNAIKLLLDNKKKINWKYLSGNLNAIDLIKDRIKYEYETTLSVKDLYFDKIDWEFLSENPNAIELLEERIKYEKTLTQQQYNDLKNKINWDFLSENPNAIQLLKNNKNEINWNCLSVNLNAIDLLKERIKYEKTLTEEQYNNLEFYEKINWEDLSQNPNAIDLLKENYDKINWDMLSSNPAIFKAI
jgi:hypothetical protein